MGGGGVECGGIALVGSLSPVLTVARHGRPTYMGNNALQLEDSTREKIFKVSPRETQLSFGKWEH